MSRKTDALQGSLDLLVWRLANASFQSKIRNLQIERKFTVAKASLIICL